MKQIGKTIIEDGIKLNNNYKIRETVRAIIIKGQEVLMLYSGLYNDYTFPGGGLKAMESHKDALKRELNEELGATNIIIEKPLGYTLEYRYGLNDNNQVYLQKSYYYIISVNNFIKPNYIGRENEQKLNAMYVNPSLIIKHNKNINLNRDRGFKTVLIRENIVLKYLLNNYL